MKKFICLLLICVALISSFTCGNAYAAEKAEPCIKGLSTSMSVKSNSEITDKIKITPYKNITVKLQYYNFEKKKWVTKYSVKANKSEVKLKYPEEWKKHLVSYWRIYCPETSKTKPFKSEKITIAARLGKMPRLNCKAAVVMEKNSHRVVYGKNMREERAMASTTKLMTALLVFENCKMNETVVISSEAPKTRFGILELQENDKYKVKQLMNALLLPSANDSATALACHISGTRNNFVKLMNTRAEELGLKNTNYTSPYGLDDIDHYSSAYDISVIHSLLLDYDEFLEIEGKDGCVVSNISKTNVKSFETTNKLREKYRRLLSGKTGTTTNAKYCFSGSYRYKGSIYVFTVLGADNDNERWKDCKKIISYIREYA